MEAYGCLWIPMDRYWCLLRSIDICGYQWMYDRNIRTLITNRYEMITMDGYRC